MEIDMKRLETAIIYLQRIADGNNPVNNMPAEDDAVLNNPNVVRCMCFVKEVLEKVQENGGKIGGTIIIDRKKTVGEVVFPFEVLDEFEYREDKGINKLLGQIYEPAKDKSIKKISGQRVNEWLIDSGYVEEVYNNELKKKIKVPTPKGISIGMTSERVQYDTNVYYTIIYNKNAQEFLIKNMKRFINGEVVD